MMNLQATAFEHTILLPDLAATQKLGAQIAAGLRPGTAVALSGDLGAGKTTLVRAILRARGVTGEIPSPSFGLVLDYDTPALKLAHIDLYRLDDPSEVEEIGLDAALAEGAVLIEWPELAQDRLGEDRLDIHLTAPSHGLRSAHMSGAARWSALIPSRSVS